jgi:hypothetical protein
MRIWHLAFLFMFVLIGMVFANTLRGWPGLSMLPQM